MSEPLLPIGVAGAPERGEPERDAWLREALRHAPDAAVSPPEALRKAILDEARATAFERARSGAAAARAATPSARRDSSPATSASPGFAGAIGALWSWLARPPVAAGFASLMAATLVGVMWWDRPLDETLPSATPPSVASEPSAASGRAKASATPSPVTAPPPRAGSMPAVASTGQREQPTGASIGAAKKADVEAARVSRDDARSDAGTVTAPARPGDSRARLAAGATSDAAAGNRVEPSVDAALDRSGGERAISQRAAPAPATVPVPLTAIATAPALAQAPPPAAISIAAPRPLSPVLASLIAEPARWSIQGAGAERVAIDAGAQTWLAALNAAGGWQPLTVPADRDLGGARRADASDNGRAVVLLQDGQPDTVIRLDGARVVVERRGGGQSTTWSATLAPALAAALASSLPPGAR